MQPRKILVDTREQIPWDFSFYGYDMIRTTLKTGDYTVEGFESLICIERKKSTGEIAGNIGKKKDAFLAELERMQSFTYRFLVCEFPKDNLYLFPKASGIPLKQQKYVRIHKNYLISFLDKLTTDYGITVIYCDGSKEAEMKVIQLIEDTINDIGS